MSLLLLTLAILFIGFGIAIKHVSHENIAILKLMIIGAGVAVIKGFFAGALYSIGANAFTVQFTGIEFLYSLMFLLFFNSVSKASY